FWTPQTALNVVLSIFLGLYYWGAWRRRVWAPFPGLMLSVYCLFIAVRELILDLTKWTATEVEGLIPMFLFGQSPRMVSLSVVTVLLGYAAWKARQWMLTFRKET